METRSPRDWWEAHRLQYNLSLVIAGIIAFCCYVAVVSSDRFMSRHPEAEITAFTTFFQGVGYLFMIAVANLCYFLGPLSEGVLHPANPHRYRRILYSLGLVFSVALPFGIPLWLLWDTFHQ